MLLEYWTFTVGDEASGYVLNIGGYSGDAGDALNVTDVYYNHNGMKFTTDDRDNDLSGGNYNCAPDRGGGWWYNACFYACLTCIPEDHEWNTLPTDAVLDVSRMMIKPQPM